MILESFNKYFDFLEVFDQENEIDYHTNNRIKKITKFGKRTKIRKNCVNALKRGCRNRKLFVLRLNDKI